MLRQCFSGILKRYEDFKDLLTPLSPTQRMGLLEFPKEIPPTLLVELMNPEKADSAIEKMKKIPGLEVIRLAIPDRNMMDPENHVSLVKENIIIHKEDGPKDIYIFRYLFLRKIHSKTLATTRKHQKILLMNLKDPLKGLLLVRSLVSMIPRPGNLNPQNCPFKFMCRLCLLMGPRLQK